VEIWDSVYNLLPNSVLETPCNFGESCRHPLSKMEQNLNLNG
jgi:hypothetical protein